MQKYNHNTTKPARDEYFVSVSVLTVTASPTLEDTEVIGVKASTVVWIPSALTATDEAMTGEAEDAETIAGCILLAAIIGTTETGLDATTWTVEDEISALGDAVTADEGTEFDVCKLGDASDCVPLVDALSACSRAN